MPVGLHTDPNIKAKIITKIRDEGVTVTEAAQQFNVNSKTIYRWLKGLFRFQRGERVRIRGAGRRLARDQASDADHPNPLATLKPEGPVMRFWAD